MSDKKELTPINNAVSVTKEKIIDYLENMGLSKKLNKEQKMQFIEIAHSLQLNPFLREIYAIPFGDKLQIVTGYETYLKRAQRSGVFNGMNCLMEKRQDDLYAICEVFRKDMTHSIKVEVPFKEYNQGNQMWKNKPQTMLRKVAISQALRMAFPEELSGIYTQDELDSNAKDIVNVTEKAEEAKQVEVIDAPKEKPVPMDKVLASIEKANSIEVLEKIMIKLGKDGYTITEEQMNEINEKIKQKEKQLQEV